MAKDAKLVGGLWETACVTKTKNSTTTPSPWKLLKLMAIKYLNCCKWEACKCNKLLKMSELLMVHCAVEDNIFLYIHPHIFFALKQLYSTENWSCCLKTMVRGWGFLFCKEVEVFTIITFPRHFNTYPVPTLYLHFSISNAGKKLIERSRLSFWLSTCFNFHGACLWSSSTRFFVASTVVLLRDTVVFNFF